MSIGKRLFRLILLVAVIIFSAQIAFDMNISGISIPITAQSLVVLLICIFLSPFEALLVTGLYVGLGLAGLPVFADGGSGIEKLSEPTGGYIIGFIISGFLISLLGRAGFTKNFFLALIAMLLGTAVLLFVGTAHLSDEHGFEKAMELGFNPFLEAGAIKSVIGALLVMFIEKGFRSKAKKRLRF